MSVLVLGVLFSLMAQMAYAIPVIDSGFNDIIGTNPEEENDACELIKEDTISHNIIAITSGAYHNCTLTDGSTVKCWGDSTYGQLGLKGIFDRIELANAHDASIMAISAGSYHTCALANTGTVKCWGDGLYGQLGNGKKFKSITPVDVQTHGIVAISSGGSNTCALTDGGTVKCWGNGFYGQLGNGGTSNSTVPVDVQISGIMAITSGNYHSCALTDQGTVKCWGDGLYGQLGNGQRSKYLIPTDVHTSDSVETPLSGIMAINSGGDHTCALTDKRTVKCWGSGISGQLGNGGNTSSLTPTDVHTSHSMSTALDNVMALSLGRDHSCALIDGGTIKCWGSGFYGQLGNGGGTASPIPVDVSKSNFVSVPLDGVLSLSAGSYHTCALMDEGAVKCWGSGRNGQLGDGKRVSSYTPVNASLLHEPVAITRCQWRSEPVPMAFMEEETRR